MGMSFAMVAASDANIECALKYPPLVWRIIAADDAEMFESAKRDAGKQSFLSRLLGNKAAVVEIDLANLAEEVFDNDLDKAWQGIHYLLTGTALEGEPPLNFICADGVEIGDVDVGYGPARAITAAEVRAIDTALSALSNDDLRKRFNPQEMMKLEIYPEIWDRDPADDDTLAYLIENIDVLRAFVRKAVDNNRGMILYIS